MVPMMLFADDVHKYVFNIIVGRGGWKGRTYCKIPASTGIPDIPDIILHIARENISSP